MGQERLSREDALLTVRTVKQFLDRGYSRQGKQGLQEKSAVRMAADALNISYDTALNRIEKGFEYYGLKPEEMPSLSEELDLAEDRPCPIELLNRHAPINEKYIAKQRMKPAVFMVPPEPFAVAFIGDPHMTNAGCNLAALREDLRLLAETRTRAVQMGDLLDNFHKIPKLAEKEAQNRLSLKEGMSLAKWLICESGVKFDAHILGNHDTWTGPEGVALMAEWVGQAQSRLFDWNARLIYKWGPGEHEQHVVAASHDFKGHSKYNPLHGPANMALFDGTADSYVAAHRHDFAHAVVPNGWRKKVYNLIRVAGYKGYDSYAAGRAQFPDFAGMEGRSALLVINPLSETVDGKSRVFMDFGEGLEVLQMLKRRKAA